MPRTRAKGATEGARTAATRPALGRCDWLDALPVAAAVLAIDGGRNHIFATNAAYVAMDRDGDLLARIDLAEALAQVLAGDVADTRFQWRDGGLIDGQYFTVSVARLDMGSDGLVRILVTLVNRTKEVRAGESLRRQNATDPLTGLANRAAFIEGLELRIADDGAEHYAMMLVDLARFSRVNEGMGALGGDELIITVAHRLTTVLRGHDLLARTGANEFAVAVKIVDGPGDLLHVARRIETALAQPFRLSDFEIKVDCAIGCALAQDEAPDAESLFGHSQLALKLAKGSRRIEIYQPAALEAARRRFLLETELRRAIERDELSMAFQPLVSLATGTISGFEALARWQHPDLGAITPTEFIAVAEDSGLIVPLGRWAMDHALKAMARWDAQAGRALPLYMSVNLSPSQVARDDVAATVRDLLTHYGLPGERLSIELTESVIVGDPSRAERMLAALKACDAQVAMDDFGTGFSNLASLQRLPIDVLKIDRSFITDMLGDRDQVAIVRAVLSLAQALGMTTTAEGIETAETALALAAMGCTTGQGYHYSRPLEADAAYAFAVNALG